MFHCDILWAIPVSIPLLGIVQNRLLIKLLPLTMTTPLQPELDVEGKQQEFEWLLVS